MKGSDPAEAPAGAKPPRMVSLDAFRGLTIMGMILVNNPGDWGHVYAPLMHADWHGCTPTDLVFPFFLFIAGCAIPMSLGRRRREGTPASAMLPAILRRTVILFACGLFLAGFGSIFSLGPDFGLGDWLHTWRIPGVLQRIAICYAVVAVASLYLPAWGMHTLNAALLLGYWGLMTLVPVPGAGAGLIDDKVNNLAAYVDRLCLGTNHLWSGSRTYDPEGLLSTLPAISTTLMGWAAGQWLLRASTAGRRAAGLLAAGGGLVVVGWIWSGWFPLNKPLWTSSYAVFTAGWAAIGLAACILLFDRGSWQAWARPLQVYGVNAITVFMLSGIVGRLLTALSWPTAEGSMSWKDALMAASFTPWFSPVNASLAYALVWVLAWYFVLDWLYRRGWVVKI